MNYKEKTTVKTTHFFMEVHCFMSQSHGKFVELVEAIYVNIDTIHLGKFPAGMTLRRGFKEETGM